MEIIVKVRMDDQNFVTEYNDLKELVEEAKQSEHRICLKYVEDNCNDVLFKIILDDESTDLTDPNITDEETFNRGSTVYCSTKQCAIF